MNNIEFKQVYKGSTNTVKGDNFQFPETASPQLERWVVTLPPESCGEWHYHLVPEFFYVEQGTLYVVNEMNDKSLGVTTYGKGEHGLTDMHVPQFIWNPNEEVPVVVVAIYLGSEGIKPTESLGQKPSEALLQELKSQPVFKENRTELDNQAMIKNNLS